MRRFGRVLGRVLLVLLALTGVLWWLAPPERVDLYASFEPRRFGEGVQVYFESVESLHGDITPGVEKRVIWREGFKERRTPVSVLYVHGFSATSEEVRPLPDRVAEALGANLVYTRLRGHGRGGAALGEVTASDWVADMAEGLAAARAVGERVVVIATSTGGTLATAAALHPGMQEGIAALVLLSPNYGINDPNAWLLTLPGARVLLPLVLGPERGFEPANAGQARYWTTAYPWSAVVSMAALVRAVDRLDKSRATVPALFRLAEMDSVVRADATLEVARDWGAEAEVQRVEMGPGDDPAAHVIAGDILSPGQTGAAVRDILDWLARQGIG